MRPSAGISFITRLSTRPLTIHTIPLVGDMATSDQEIDTCIILLQDLGNFDSSTKVYALSFDPETVSEAHDRDVVLRWWCGGVVELSFEESITKDSSVPNR